MLFNKIFREDRAQLSLEYILIAMMSILLITLISIPILGLSIDYSFDVVDSLNAKTELSKITEGIDFCYNSGKGSKKIVLIDLNNDLEINLLNNNSKGLAVADLDLSNNDSKTIYQSFDCPLLNENIVLSKGFNKVLIEWSDESGLIEVSKIN